jgi:hypothetical protein
MESIENHVSVKLAVQAAIDYVKDDACTSAIFRELKAWRSRHEGVWDQPLMAFSCSFSFWVV